MINRKRTLALYALGVASIIAPLGKGSEVFRCETLDGQTLEISDEFFFVIASKSEADLAEALRCATWVSSIQPKISWIIHLNWPQLTGAKRRAVLAALQSDYMKAHSTIDMRPLSHKSLVSLLDTELRVVWSADSYPNDDDRSSALSLLNEARP